MGLTKCVSFETDSLDGVCFYAAALAVERDSSFSRRFNAIARTPPNVPQNNACPDMERMRKTADIDASSAGGAGTSGINLKTSTIRAT